MNKNWLFCLILVSLTSMMSCLFIFFPVLLKQSQHPSGRIGILMMRIWNLSYLPMVKRSLRSVEEPPKKILDIGIGNGRSTHYLKTRFPTSIIYGIDHSETAIKQAKKITSSGLIVEVQNIERTHYPSQNFDLICAFQTHFYWKDLTVALLEIKRILKRNGTLLIACESSKIKYYLPDFQDIDSFKTYLTSLGLHLAYSHCTKEQFYYRISHLLP